MTENVENLILEQLRLIRGENARTHEALSELTQRVGSLETQTANVHTDLAAHSLRLDRVSTRLDRIEKRLGLVDA